MAEPTFDPAAEFLLSMAWHNLFEPTGGQFGNEYRCKGCRAIVPVGEREKHFNKHKGVRQRSETMRQAKIKRERQARMEKARAARSKGS